MQIQNYQRWLDNRIEELQAGGMQEVPTLLLHSCCAPCSSYTLEYLSQYFAITVYYYNPNIYPKEEYMKRVEEQRRFIAELTTKNPVSFVEGEYLPDAFWAIARGFEDCPEGGERCRRCFELRLRESARIAREGEFDYFTTTLTISPMKNAAILNEIGSALGAEYDVAWLYSDFKKKNGYKRSIELSAEHQLYRQDFCGCIYSQREKQLGN